ncbi:MAG: signal peptidase II [bacterium]
MLFTNQKIIRYLIIFASGFFFLLDRFLKYKAASEWIAPRAINRFLGWTPFLNDNAAFGLPISSGIILTITIPIIILLLALAITEKKQMVCFFAWTMALAGAISNMIDRIVYGHVIDYFTFATGIINIADIMIVAGLLSYLIAFKTTKAPRHNE